LPAALSRITRCRPGGSRSDLDPNAVRIAARDHIDLQPREFERGARFPQYGTAQGVQPVRDNVDVADREGELGQPPAIHRCALRTPHCQGRLELHKLDHRAAVAEKSCLDLDVVFEFKQPSQLVTRF
jgi:hypothetical protein